MGNLSDRVDIVENFDVQAYLSNIFARGSILLSYEIYRAKISIRFTVFDSCTCYLNS